MEPWLKKRSSKRKSSWLWLEK